MALTKKIQVFGITGKTIYGLIVRGADGYFLQSALTSFAAGVSYPALIEDGTAKGLYTLSTNGTVWTDGTYVVTVYQQSGGSPAPASDQVIGGDSFWVTSDAIITLDASIAAIPVNPQLATSDFNSVQKTSLNAATPASVQNIAAQTGDSYARLGVAGAGLTVLGDPRVANLDATISSRLKPADTLAAVTSATLAAAQPSYAPAKAGDAMALTTGERTTLAGTIWNTLTSALSTAGSIGKLLVDNINASISAIKAKTDNLPADPASAAAVATQVGAVPTLRQIVNGVLDEPLDSTHHNTAGTTGSKITAAPTSFPPVIVVAPVSNTPAPIQPSSNLITMYRGDTRNQIFPLDRAYIGWEPWFAARKIKSDGTADLTTSGVVITPRAVVWTDDVCRNVLVALTPDDLSTAGQFVAEIELRFLQDSTIRLTAQQYIMKITQDIIS